MQDRDIRQLPVKAKRYRVAVGGQVYVDVLPTGRRVFRVRVGNSFRSLGDSPAMSLKAAREAAVRALATEAPESDRGGALFVDAARQYLRDIVSSRAAKTRANVEGRIFRYLVPALGQRPMDQITGQELLGALRAIEADGLGHTAQRCGILFGQIARHAIAHGRCERDVWQDIRGALAPHRHRHYAAITDPRELGGLLRAIDGFRGRHVPVEIGLRLAPLLALRPGELRGGEWSEVDFDGALWRIPAARMKMSAAHVVPLARQSLDLLRQLRQHHNGELMFPSVRSASRPISDNTLNAALRQLGYTKDQQVAHGFRRTFSTLLNEQGVNPDWIEAQLAHRPGGVRAVYNAAQYLPQRREMMQGWADYLDSIKSS